MTFDGLPGVGPCLIRGLPVPPLLLRLLATGRWRHPGETVIRIVLPWFEDPLDFLTSRSHMEDASRSLDLFAMDELSARYFHTVRGSTLTHPVRLPYLDVEQAFYLAVNREPGDDVAVALDYRSDPTDPQVVASDCWTGPHLYQWRLVASTFTAFATMLGLLDPR